MIYRYHHQRKLVFAVGSVQMYALQCYYLNSYIGFRVHKNMTKQSKAAGAVTAYIHKVHELAMIRRE